MYNVVTMLDNTIAFPKIDFSYHLHTFSNSSNILTHKWILEKKIEKNIMFVILYNLSCKIIGSKDSIAENLTNLLFSGVPDN